jgi:hypothetical protein
MKQCETLYEDEQFKKAAIYSANMMHWMIEYVDRNIKVNWGRC